MAGSTISTGYAYDGVGEQTSDGGMGLVWDSGGLLARTTGGDGAVTDYDHDALGRLSVQSSGASTVDYYYGGFDDTPVAAGDTSGAVEEQFVRLPGAVTVTLRSTAQVWSHPDLEGNVTLVTDGSGIPQGAMPVYDPWGARVGGSVPDNGSGLAGFAGFGGDGKLTAVGTGLVLLGARVFSPGQARFLSVDPVTGGCADAYVYAHGDPLSQHDLDGRFCWKDWALVAVGIVGFAAVIVAPFVGGPIVSGVLAIGGGVLSGASFVMDSVDCIEGSAVACGGAALGGAGLAFSIGNIFVDGPALGIASDEFSGGGTMIDIAGAAQAVHPGGGC